MMSLFPMPGAVILAVDDTPSHLRLLRNLITSVGGRLAAQNVGVIHRDLKPSNIFLHKQLDALVAWALTREPTAISSGEQKVPS